MLYLDELLTGLSEKAQEVADNIGRRGLSTHVKKELREGAESLGTSADHYRGAGWAMFEHHSDLFNLVMSKGTAPIGS